MAGRHLTRHLRPNATKTMIVYSKATGVRRLVVDADHDDAYDHHRFADHEDFSPYEGRGSSVTLIRTIINPETGLPGHYWHPQTGELIPLVKGTVFGPDGGLEAHEQHPGKGVFYLTHAEYDAYHCPHHLNHTTVLRSGFKATLHQDDFGNNSGVTVHHPADGDYDIHTADWHAVCHPDGTVVASICCDPTCGDHPEHVEQALGLPPGVRLIKHAEAGAGWTHENGVLIPPAKYQNRKRGI